MFGDMRVSIYKRFKDSDVEKMLKNSCFIAITEEIERLRAVNVTDHHPFYREIKRILKEMRSPLMIQYYIDSMKDVNEMVDNNGCFSASCDVEEMIKLVFKYWKSRGL